MINSINDTISAIATALGTGGVGIVRISGEKSKEIATKIFSKSAKTVKQADFIPNYFQYGWVRDEDKLIDEVMVVYFKAPNSFTGEDVVEIHCHGGMNVIKAILQLTLKNGARIAERGEFTKRAFLNGKIDLSKAESILDIIQAKTTKFSELSAQNLGGKLALEIQNLRNELIAMFSQIVAAIDFPEEVEEPEYEKIEEDINGIIPKIDKILRGATSSNLMRQGIKLAIVGRPNVGKSSLFNFLLNMDRAIVTDIAGTTRDVLAEVVDIDGIPVTLVDTAGIREVKSDGDSDKIESIGIDISKQCIKDADAVLFVTSLSEPQNADDMEIYEAVKSKPHLILGSKSDISANVLDETLKQSNFISISTFSKDGMDELYENLKKIVHLQNIENTEWTTNLRQQECLENAKKFLETALMGVRAQEMQDLISIDIKSAIISLGEITGEEVTEEILDSVFANFCVGK